MRNGRGMGNYPGNGPFSHLPPWQRPGYLYGRGACRYLYTAPYSTPLATPQDETAILNDQKTAVETQIKAMHETLAKIQERLNAINK
jgi:hypothetical protein